MEICNGTALTESNHCASLLASFTQNGGVNNGGQLLSIPAGEEMYKVEWHTGSYNLPVGEPLRVLVLLGDFVAGYIDVTRSAGGGFDNAETHDPISGNGTLPIKFRIEHGVICGSNPNCSEWSVGPNGGTFTVADGDDVIAGAQFPVGALSQTVNLVINEVTGAECLPTDLEQFNLCFQYSTQPYVPNFNVPVIVAFCMTDPAALNYLSDGELRLWKWSETNGDAMVELERVTVDFLDCPDLSGISYRSDSPWLRGLARAGGALLAPIAALVGPSELHAIGSEGGKLINFSRIGWVRPLAIEITQGNNQTGTAGAALPVDPTVRVTNRYGVGAHGVAGKTVQFTPSQDGIAAPPSGATDANGLAQTAWTLATAAGANTLLAHVPTSRPAGPAPYETEVTFNATGVAPVASYNVKWLPPLVAKSATTATLVKGLSPISTITEVGGNTLAVLPMTAGSKHYAASWNIPVLQPNKTYRIAVSTAGVEHGYVLLEVVNGQLRNVTTGDKVLNLKNSRTLPIKVILYE